MGDLKFQSSMRIQFLLMMIGASLFTMICMGIIFFKSMVAANEEEVRTYRESLVSESVSRLYSSVSRSFAYALSCSIWKRFIRNFVSAITHIPFVVSILPSDT